MDFDDNDLRNQNFELAGEDNNRFPQTLRTFSLPKFNFDDHLQVQIRFDSLTGSECLLDMQGQEDNWIEEFSPRHSAIEFSSNAAESCSITRHNNIWFEATSSETVEMLLKSVGEDEMINQKLVSKETSKLASNESNCRMEDNAHKDLLGSNENVVAVQLPSVGTSESSKPEKLEMNRNLVLDEKLHVPREAAPEKLTDFDNLEPTCSVANKFLEVVQSDYSLNKTSRENNLADDFDYSAGNTNKLCPRLVASCIQGPPSALSADGLNIVPEQCTDAENSNPPSVGAKCLAVDEFLDVVQSDGSLHNAPISKGSASNFDCPARTNNEVSPMLLTCSEDVPSVLSTANGSIISEKPKQTGEDCNEISIEHELETLQPDNRPEGSCRKFSASNEVDHQHVEDHAVSKDSCNMMLSSDIEPPVPSTFLNSTIDSVSSQNSVGLLDTIAHVDNDSGSYDKSLPCSDKMSSVSVERGKDVERDSVEAANEHVKKLSENAACTEYTTMVGFQEESASSKSVIADRQEPELCNKSSSELISSSETLVDQQVLAIATNETRLNEVKDGSCDKNNTSHAENPDSAASKKAINYVIEDIIEKSGGDFGSSQKLSPEKSLVHHGHIRTSSSIEVKSVPISDTCNLGNSNKDNAIYVEPFSYGKVVNNPPLDLCCASSKVDSLVVVAKAASQAQDISLTKADTDKLHADEAALQHLQSEDSPSTFGAVEVKVAAAGSLLPASGCIEDPNTSLPAEKKNLVHFTSIQLVTSSDSAINSGATENSMDKDGSIDQGKDAKFASEDIGNGHNIVQTSSGALNVPADHPSNATVLKTNSESTNSLNFGSGNQNHSEAKCGSPTIISCNERGAEHPKGVAESSDRTGPAFEAGNIHQNKYAIGDSKQSIASEDDESFTFEIQLVSDQSHKDTGDEWKPFSDMQSSKPPGPSAENPEVGEKNSEVRDKHSNISNAGNKKKQASSPSSRKVENLKGNSKEKLQQKQAKGGSESKIGSLSPGLDSTAKSKTSKEAILQYPCLGSSSPKSSCSRIQAPNLPDHNGSVSKAASFHQPFTDLQQVQLRAQIFVYGSLIQGVPPDEACMISAFGGADGGRSLWEGSVRAASERFALQKSPFNTPVHSRLGVSTTEQASDSSSLHGKALKLSPGQNSNKVVASVAVNSTAYWLSPFWSRTNDGLPSNTPRGTRLEFNQSVSPNVYQSLQSRQCTSNSSPWLSQSPRAPLWIFPSQSSPLDVRQQYSAIPPAETVELPGKDASLPRAANLPPIPSSLLPNQGLGNLSVSLDLREESQKNSASPVSSKNESAGSKSRRKKKVSSSQELGSAFPVSHIHTECTSAVDKQISAPSSLSLPAVTSTAATSCLVSATSQTISPTNIQIIGNSDFQQRTLITREILMGIEQSKFQAESASSQAATAVKHSQDVWSQLASHRESGLVSEVEKKLASAAVAAAAAVSVAKAAAEAAKLASEAALQAKLMADDTLNTERTVSDTQNAEFTSIAGKNLGWLGPTSILENKDKVDGTNSIISAAREAARKRVEAASAATKRAENLDAILKAAELAVEAVSQAGTIIAMGDPIPFSMHELVEAGPTDYWKVARATTETVRELKHVQQEEILVHDLYISEAQASQQTSNQKNKQKLADGEGMYMNGEPSMQSEENDAGMDLGNSSIIAPTDILSKDSLGSSRYGSGIQKGSLVEVAAIDDGLRGAWFSAWVLDMKDGQFYVCYKDLLCDEGCDQLKEWIPLECDSDRAPRIRAAHPLTINKCDGTRKRRREAVGNHAWAVGDRVDVWLRDGWWEGIVTEKSPEDETKLTVHFPAGGDSSFVRSWNLRSSFTWKDGQWLEWTRDKIDMLDAHQDDTPFEKRRKTSQLEPVGRAKAPTKNVHMTKIVESSTLDLSEKDKLFCIGEDVKEKNNATSNRVQRTGLQKEGSRVIFGVPKPGKKRKFMEVSKHYTSEMSGKVNEVNAFAKFTKYLMPKASHSWKESSKVNTKETQVTDSKNRTSKPSRPQNVHSKSKLEKDNLSVISISAVNDAEYSLSSTGSLRTFSKENGTTGRKKQLAEAVPCSRIPLKVDAPGPESCLPPLPVIASSKEKNSATEQTRGKVKYLPGMHEFTGSEDKITEDLAKTADVVEPRRSRRRIQPTSRLLEGLQSSLIMSNIPSVSHDKGTKGLRRVVSSSQGHGRR